MFDESWSKNTIFLIYLMGIMQFQSQLLRPVMTFTRRHLISKNKAFKSTFYPVILIFQKAKGLEFFSKKLYLKLSFYLLQIRQHLINHSKGNIIWFRIWFPMELLVIYLIFIIRCKKKQLKSTNPQRKLQLI